MARMKLRVPEHCQFCGALGTVTPEHTVRGNEVELTWCCKACGRDWPIESEEAQAQRPRASRSGGRTHTSVTRGKPALDPPSTAASNCGGGRLNPEIPRTNSLTARRRGSTVSVPARHGHSQGELPRELRRLCPERIQRIIHRHLQLRRQTFEPGDPENNFLTARRRGSTQCANKEHMRDLERAHLTIKHYLLHLPVVLCACTAASCGSTSVAEVTAPSGARCTSAVTGLPVTPDGLDCWSLALLVVLPTGDSCRGRPKSACRVTRR